MRRPLHGLSMGGVFSVVPAGQWRSLVNGHSGLRLQGTAPMTSRLSEYQLFVREYVRNFRTTGAILPSSRGLARALSRYVAGGQPKRILEVGPGTGAVTEQIIARMGPDDRLDLVELNGCFVQRLQERFEEELVFRGVAPRCRIFHQPVEELPAQPTYDVIVSGLPLNNFTPEEVAKILGVLRGLLRPGGTLSFFEYIGVRLARSWLGRRQQRRRLRGITRVLVQMLEEHEIRRDWIWRNVPPAWVHHVRFDLATPASPDSPFSANDLAPQGQGR